LVEETEISGENHWQTLSHNVVPILPIIKQNEQLSLSPQTVEHKKVFFKKCNSKL
jgi:hypothetical protein